MHAHMFMMLRLKNYFMMKIMSILDLYINICKTLLSLYANKHVKMLIHMFSCLLYGLYISLW